MIEIEICVEAGNAAGARAVAQAVSDGGAARLELCAHMDADGLTPSWQSLRLAREVLRRRGVAEIPLLMMMVRPRGGDFQYSLFELAQMLRAVELAARWGADGVVLGMLEESRGGLRVAMRETGALVRRAEALGLQVTFHRAFDAAAHRDAALEALVDLGVQRVLTAGIPWGVRGTAVDGLPGLRRTLERAHGRLEMIVAGSVSPALVPPLLAGLAGVPGRFSLHAYSGAQQRGKTTPEGVRALVLAAKRGGGG